MIIDAHTHVFRVWPFEPIERMVAYPNSRGVIEVPDPMIRGSAEQLLLEMDMNNVDRAVIVCLLIAHNADNNDYAAEWARRHPDRLIPFADVDSYRSDTYQTPGAADRLRTACERNDLKGFTHYIRRGDDGSWYLSQEGAAFFDVAAEHRLIASLSCPDPERLQPVLRQVAERFPEVTFLIHHMGLVKASEEPPHAGLRALLDSARLPNVYVKLSGPYYVSRVPWEYPYSDCTWIVRSLYEHYGPDRLCWGSDWPVVRDAMNCRQSLEWLRGHCPFIPKAHVERILGGNIERLLNT